MTILVKQRTMSDCGVCCLAMLTGRVYEDVLTVIGDAFDPAKGLRHDQQALERLGFKNTYDNGHPIGDMVFSHRTWCLSPDFYRSMAWGRRALITVPSLNIKDGWHMVYYDGKDVFDPSNGKVYLEFHELQPQEIVLFREFRV